MWSMGKNEYIGYVFVPNYFGNNKKKLKKKDQTLKTYYKNINCLRRDSRVPFRVRGGHCLVETVLLICWMVWHQIWSLGLQFPHLYQGEVDPIVSGESSALTSGNEKLHCLVGLCGAFSALWGFPSEAEAWAFGSGCHPPRSVGDSRAALALWADQLSCPPGVRGALPGPWKPSESPGLGTVRTNAGIAAGLIVSLSGFGIEQLWPMCVIKTEMVWLGTLAQWPCPQHRSLWQQLNRVPRAQESSFYWERGWLRSDKEGLIEPCSH